MPAGKLHLYILISLVRKVTLQGMERETWTPKQTLHLPQTYNMVPPSRCSVAVVVQKLLGMTDQGLSFVT